MTRSLAAAAALLSLALPDAAFAETTDFLTVKKISCSPDRVTRCKAVGVECETKDATPRDKGNLLVVDFAGKKVFSRRNGEDKPFGVVLEDKVNGDGRDFVLGRSAEDTKNTLIFRLMKDGKMTGTRNEGKIKMEATCKAEG
ncbi:MAG: hypothetical protein KIT16_14500 [Rhodospirillaceae bacterium]|nr:hypothetical protein [Rhodospirillaceae bacterium]